MAEELLRAQIQTSQATLKAAEEDLLNLRGAASVLGKDMKMGAIDPVLAREEMNKITARIERTIAFITATRERLAILQGQLEAVLEALAKAEEDPEILDGPLDGEDEILEPPAKPPTGDESAQLKHMGGLLGRFGTLGALREDGAIGAGIAGSVKDFFESLGLTPETLEGLKASPLNRELSAKWATGISTAAQTGLGLLYSIGIITEVASLGQVDTLVDAIDNMITNLGIDEIIKPLFTAPYYAALTIPTRQYWMSVFKPTVPPIQDLRVMAVREAFPVETREEQFTAMQEWGAYHGLDEFWMEVYLKAGYERMDVRTAIAMVYWRNWGEEELKKFLSIADVHPDDHPAILATLWRNPTRYERRHGYMMGVYTTEDLEKFFHRDGLRDEDAVTATKAMTAYALNAERNAVARAAGRIYRETLGELHDKIVDLQTALTNAVDFVVAVEMNLEAGVEWVTQEHMREASAHVAHVKAELSAWKVKAEPIRVKAEAELRAELTTLMLTGERQDLWVRRYAMEARVKTRPWEILEEAGPLTTLEPEA